MGDLMTKRIVIALGGNAILTDDPSANGQKEALMQTAKQIIPLIKEGHQLIITHGNGPQVGNLLLQQEAANTEKNPAMPLDTCVAMTQGSMGYWLQHAITKVLQKEGINKHAVSLITQVVVDEKDEAFLKPSKPIGPFYTKEQIKNVDKKNDYMEDSGRGYRRVVPSPKPIDIVETSIIETLIEQDVLPIVAGGGGVPVIQSGDGYEGIEAVIDKDFASAKLAQRIQADELIILTGVSHAYINFNQPDQQRLGKITSSEMEKSVEEKQFASGSMLPKVEAAISFVEKNPHGRAVITSLENLEEYIKNDSGTIITNPSLDN